MKIRDQLVLQLTDLIEPLDTFIALHLEKVSDVKNDPCYFLFLYLAFAYRTGHLFIEKKEDKIFPSLFNNDVIDALILEGFNELENYRHPNLVFDRDRLFLQKAYADFTSIDYHVKRLQKSIPRYRFDTIEHKLEELSKIEKLLPEQLLAIKQGCLHTLSSITGGPGTGKTHTAGFFLRMILENNTEKNYRIALCAPTGKAVHNLFKSLKRACSKFGNLDDLVDVKTIHGLLGKGFSRFRVDNNKAQYFDYDLIVVDESSMIDAHMMAEFLSKVADGTRVLFLGDPNQLPPVEPGDVFHYLLQDQNSHQKLTQCMRFDGTSLIQLSQSVCKKDIDTMRTYLQGNDDIHFYDYDGLSIEERKKLIREKIDQFLYRLCDELKKCKNPEEFFVALQRYRLLAPFRHGTLGCNNINEYALKMLGKLLPQKFRSYMPILVTKNDFELGVTNGEVGLLYMNDEKRKEVLFEDLKSSESFRSVPLSLLSEYEPAYCLSVHKSQGSEFENVFLLFPEESESFGARMLYTAITRAKKRIEILSSMTTLKNTIQA